MACNDNLIETLLHNLGRQCTITNSGETFSGILSDVNATTCTLISTRQGKCPAAQRVRTIPIEKISCLTTSQM